MSKKENNKKAVFLELKKNKFLEVLSDKEIEIIEDFLLNLSDICYKIYVNERK